MLFDYTKKRLGKHIFAGLGAFDFVKTRDETINIPMLIYTSSLTKIIIFHDEIAQTNKGTLTNREGE